MDSTEHSGSVKFTNRGDDQSNWITANQIKSNVGENRSTQGTTSQSRVESQQTQPIKDDGSKNRTRTSLVESVCSHYCACATPALTGLWIVSPTTWINSLVDSTVSFLSQDFEDPDRSLDPFGLSLKDHHGEPHIWRCGQCSQTFSQRVLLQMHVCPQVTRLDLLKTIFCQLWMININVKLKSILSFPVPWPSIPVWSLPFIIPRPCRTARTRCHSH